MRAKVLVISMTTATDRRKQITAMLESASFDWDFFDAYTEKHEDLQLSTKNRLLPAEIGCYSSHYSCWKFLSNSEYEQLLILEDDVLIDVPFIQRLLNAEFNEVNIGFIKLFAKIPFRYKYISRMFTFFHIVRYTTKTLGTQSYILQKNATHSLLESAVVLDEPVDRKLDNHFMSLGDSFILFPFPVIEKNIESQISMDRFNNKHTSIGFKVISVINKIYNEIKCLGIKYFPLTRKYKLIRSLIIEKKLD